MASNMNSISCQHDVTRRDTRLSRSTRRRKRGARRLRQILLCLGSVGLILGVFLFLVYLFQENGKLGIIGIIYVLFSLTTLGIYGVLLYLSEDRRKKYPERRNGRCDDFWINAGATSEVADEQTIQRKRAVGEEMLRCWFVCRQASHSARGADPLADVGSDWRKPWTGELRHSCFRWPIFRRRDSERCD